VVLLVGKLVATTLTLAIGGSGGIFAPSLFLGAMAGTALGDGFGLLGAPGAAGAYGLVGMAAVLAGATRAPITAVVIVAEITGEWDLVVPLMIAVVIATAVSQALSTETIYTLKLTRRGIHLHPPGTPRVARRTAGEAVPPTGPSGLDGAARPLGPLRWAPVLDADRPLGAALDDLTTDLAGRDGGAAGLPVLAADGGRLLGILRPDDVVAGTAGVVRDDRDGACVVEILVPPPPGWAPPDGFRVLDGADRLLVGPRAGLDALVASLPDEEPTS
jgi:CIC family chloride channel protein